MLIVAITVDGPPLEWHCNIHVCSGLYGIGCMPLAWHVMAALETAQPCFALQMNGMTVFPPTGKWQFEFYGGVQIVQLPWTCGAVIYTGLMTLVTVQQRQAVPLKFKRPIRGPGLFLEVDMITKLPKGLAH